MLGDDEDATELAGWVERTVGGTVTRGRAACARWRPAWDVDVEVDGRSSAAPRARRARAEDRDAVPHRRRGRGPRPARSARLPVPHAYGLCDDPYALVMDRLPGLVDLSFATDDDEREHLARRLPRAARRGSTPSRSRPRRPPASRSPPTPPPPASRSSGGWRSVTTGRWTVSRPTRSRCSSAAGWRRTCRRHRRAEARFITYDSFQFMFADGRITGLLDFEHAHVGDPMMDLAALEDPRHAQEPRRPRRDRRPVRGDHGCRRSTTTSSSTTPSCTTRSRSSRWARRWPIRCAGTDWLSYLAWYVNGARWAFEVDRRDPRVPARTGRDPGRAADPPRAGLPAPGGEPPRRGIVRLPRRLRARRARPGREPPPARRRDRSGTGRCRPRRPGRVLGHRPDPAEADAELVEFVGTRGSGARGGARPPPRRAGAADAPQHGVAAVVDAAPSTVAQPPPRSRHRACGGGELARGRDPGHPLTAARVHFVSADRYAIEMSSAPRRSRLFHAIRAASSTRSRGVAWKV